MTKTYQRADLTFDQCLALETAAATLQREFAEVFGVETIERFLYSSDDEFAGKATIGNFLPLLAERFARQRLRALAKVQGPVDRRASHGDAASEPCSTRSARHRCTPPADDPPAHPDDRSPEPCQARPAPRRPHPRSPVALRA